MDSFDHQTVLLKETTENLLMAPILLDGDSPHWIVDGTFGGGGHGVELLEQNPSLHILGIDCDPLAIENGQKLIKAKGFQDRVKLVHGYTRHLQEILSENQIPAPSGILLDLGVSSPQLDQPERGFSFMKDGPLDMRMNPDDAIPTAAEILNRSPEKQIADILFEYGEERLGKKIARWIVEARSNKPFESTKELADLCSRAYGSRNKKKERIHPATRTFQALRIAVNNELSQLEEILKDGTLVLRGGGRICVITFHSLEDRIAKHTFKELSRSCICPPSQLQCNCRGKPILKVLTKKPLLPTDVETAENPRSRSAKLRCVEKINEFT